MNDTDSTEFGTWLVGARGRADMTQEELAEATGVHVNTIKNLELGKTKRPSAGVASSLRDYFGARPALTLVRDEYDRHTQSFLDLVGAYLMAQPEDKRFDRILDLVRYIVTPK